MFAIPGILLLVAAIILRPQEVLASVQAVPLLHSCMLLAVIGVALDLRLRNIRLALGPTTPWMLLFVLWAVASSFVRAPGEIAPKTFELAICAALYLLIAHGVQSFRALGVVAAVVFLAILLAATVAVHQSQAPLECARIDESVAGDTATALPDGRPCQTRADCYLGDPEPGAEYFCEHAGLLGTTSVGQGRVRYRGILQDPNELGLAGAVALPLAYAWSRSRRGVGRRLLLVSSFLLLLGCAVLTRSRTAQLAFLAVLTVPFVRRFGLRGLSLGLVLSAPLLLLGGREGIEASSSTLERMDCWAEAISIWRAHPLLGAGLGQFGKYHYLTAHNSYLLALAELGPLGLFLFTAVVYQSVKIPLVAWRACDEVGPALGSDGAFIVRPWALGLVGSGVALAVGTFFLSFAYHYLLWILVGLSGALYAAIRRHEPEFRVRFGWRDALAVAAIDVVLVAVVFLYTRHVLS